jgi:hypothetical protein
MPCGRGEGLPADWEVPSVRFRSWPQRRAGASGRSWNGTRWVASSSRFHSTESVKLWGCRARTHVTALLALRLSFPVSGSLRQTRAKDVHGGHDRPHSLLSCGQGGPVTWDELAQQNLATTQRPHGLKAFEKTLPSDHRLDSSGATQPVPNGDMATFDALGGLAPTPMQTSPDVGGAGQDSPYCLHIGLVMIADHLVRLQHPPLHRSTEEGFGRSQIAALKQEHIHHLPSLIDGSIKVVLLTASA